MSRFQQICANPHGRDFAVGDIHGHFSRLRAVLKTVDFDTSVDRLFSVGDLVDRGPESVQCLEWLAQPWFFAVQGNHEALAIQHVQGRIADYRLYMASGGAWFVDLPPSVQRSFAERFAQMPIALQVETADGPVGLVHADCPLPSWAMLRDTLLGHLPGLERAEEVCQWSRERQRSQDVSGIPDLRAMVVGHTHLPNPDVLGNVFHIDTGGWRSDGRGRFTLLDLARLAFC